jgi:oligoendopeptidase F
MSGLEAFYPRENAARAATAQNEEVFRLFVWVAIIDSFQHWIYSHPRHSTESRNRAWVETMERFQAGLDWSGLDEYRKTAWHRQLHIFQYPFYYIEYGIALAGALQLWTHFLKDRKKTMARYKAALSRGGTIGLRQLFETAGITFDFSPRTMEPLIMKVYDDWKRLRGV